MNLRTYLNSYGDAEDLFLLNVHNFLLKIPSVEGKARKLVPKLP